MLFTQLLNQINLKIVYNIFKITLSQKQRQTKSIKFVGENPYKKQMENREVEDNRAQAAKSSKIDVGRNDPCPCGSGKKYKKCCEKL